jgi:hypothetical protein
VLERETQLVGGFLTRFARPGKHFLQIAPNLSKRFLVVFSEFRNILTTFLAVRRQRCFQLLGSGSMFVRDLAHEGPGAVAQVFCLRANLGDGLIPHTDRGAEMVRERLHSVGEFRHDP